MHTVLCGASLAAYMLTPDVHNMSPEAVREHCASCSANRGATRRRAYGGFARVFCSCQTGSSTMLRSPGRRTSCTFARRRSEGLPADCALAQLYAKLRTYGDEGLLHVDPCASRTRSRALVGLAFEVLVVLEGTAVGK